MKITLFKTWAEDNIEPCNWGNRKKYKNYCAVVTLDDDGKETRKYLKISDDYDLFFQFSPDIVKVGNILVASCWDIFKRRQYKSYYIVKEITPEHVMLSDPYTTYRKASKSFNN